MHALPPDSAAWLLALAQRALAGESWTTLYAAATEACREQAGWSALVLLRSRLDGQFVPRPDGQDTGEPLSSAVSLDLRRALDQDEPVALADDAASALADVLQASAADCALAVRAGQPAQSVSDPQDHGQRSPADVFVALRQALGNVLGVALRQREAALLLQRSEAQSRAILEATVDGIITIDERGSILTMNPAAERIFGYATEEVYGCNVKVLMPPPYRDEHDGYMAAYRETGHRRIIGIGRMPGGGMPGGPPIGGGPPGGRIPGGGPMPGGGGPGGRMPAFPHKTPKS